MITTKNISGTEWVAITTAGQQGTCWINENREGGGGVYIAHSNTGDSPKGRVGFRIYRPNDNTNVCIMGPDDSNDIFFARCVKVRDNVKILVDVI